MAALFSCAAERRLFMCTGGHGRDRQRRRSHYASRYSTSPYTTLAAVPNTITGPATVNILTAVPVTMPSGCVKIDIQFFRNFFSCLQSGGRLLF